MSKEGATRNGGTKGKDDELTNGAKIKMPAAQLAQVTKARNKLEELLTNDSSVYNELEKNLQKCEDEIVKLEKQCGLILVLDDMQQAQKDDWVKKNVVQLRDWLKDADQRVKAKKPKDLTLPQVVVHDAEGDDKRSRKSALSRKSKASSLALEFEAEMAALQVEKERMLKRQAQEEEERRLRQQREQDDLEAKMEQLRVRQEVLSRAGSKASAATSISSRPRRLLELPPATRRTSDWVRTTSNPIIETAQGAHSHLANPGHSAATVDAATALYQQTLLPASKLPIFNGNYLEFPWFIRSFEMMVEGITTDPTRRLHLLLQHLQGEPHTLVKGFHLAPLSQAFQLAKQELIQRYGNPIRQSLAFKEQLLAWTDVKKDSSTDLEKFYVQLRLCQAMRQSNGGMLELDSSSTLVRLMRKLPKCHQDAWLKRVYRVESSQIRSTNYDDFVQFVQELSETANHPVFGKHHTDSQTMKRATTMTTHIGGSHTDHISQGQETDQVCVDHAQETTIKTTTSAAEGVNKNAFKRPCLICQCDHLTLECKNFESVSLEDRKARLKGLCFRCLRGDHWARNCRTPLKCDLCSGRHPTLLHDESKAPKATKEETSAVQNETCGATVRSSPGSGCIAAVPVRVWLTSASHPIITQAILDTASSTSFISESLAAKLEIRLKKTTTLKLNTVMDATTTETAIIRGLSVADVDGNNRIELPGVYTLPRLPSCTPPELLQDEVKKWKHLAQVPFAWNQYSEDVGLLLGQDVPDALCPLESVRSNEPNEPYASQTALGWTFNGPRISAQHPAEPTSLSQTSQPASTSVAAALEQLYHNGMEDLFNFHDKGLSQEDHDWLQSAESSICRSTEYPERYQIALPLQSGAKLHDNFKQAQRQLNTLRRKFNGSDQFKRDYVEFMAKMEDAGYVERVDTTFTPSMTSYVPHHGVYHPRKPDKIRVVFNCSSKFQNVSLNDCLISGPDLTNSLLGVLLRFRQDAVAFIADVESMFYRVLVPKAQRDVLRYLWWPGGDTNQEPQVYRMTVHLFGATSSPSCANFALRRAADDAHKEGLVNEATKEAVHRNFYVDDCLKPAATDDEAIDLALGLIKACQHGGFKLTKFVSTSPALLRALPPDRLGKGVNQADLENKHNPLVTCHERALGVAWDVKQDAFHFKLQLTEQAVITKRTILSTLSTVYDPIGMAAPVVITARMLFRELTRDKNAANWDEEIQNDTATKWINWLRNLHEIQAVTVPRCYGRSHKAQEPYWQLHAFCDSSLDAYAVVIYLRHGQDEPRVTFVVGKARVTPPKIATVPRLELTAAKLAVDMMRTTEQQLQFHISRRVFWSDSQTVLKYLHCKKRRFHTFVANRVQSILAASDINEWRFVPSSLNPADEATRGLSPKELNHSKWLHGPLFLEQAEDQWPAMSEQIEPQMDDPEVKDVVVANTTAVEPPFIHIIAARYSSLYRFKKAVAIWIKFKMFLANSRTRNLESTHLSARDLTEAGREALKWLQREIWTEEISELQKGRQVKRASPLWKLSPALHDGLVVMNSRTRVALPIVPAGPLADLIILESHHHQLHYGRQSTSAATLQRFWIIGLNKAVRRIIRSCPSCQLRHAQPTPEEMAVLPQFRLDSNGHAFHTTGVDYFGPFTVKYGARSTTKVYGVVFTCATTRAVHLEAAEDLSSSGFINALRRFIARRGPVRKFISDNGTNFSGANTELQEALQQEISRCQESSVILAELRKQEIEWTFNAPGASHHGGFWERIIRSIRQAFEALLNIYRPLTVINFLTLLCEIEAALNSRPLTNVSEDPNDLDALTPNHLLLLRSGPPSMPTGHSSPPYLQQHWRHIQHLAKTFWKRWVLEYRTALHQRTAWLAKNNRPLRIGDIVLVLDPLRHRRYWDLGRITDLYEDTEDKKPRVVQVQTKKGSYARPITKLCLLETASQSDN